MRNASIKSIITAIALILLMAFSVIFFACSESYAAGPVRFSEPAYRVLKNRSVSPRNLGINLRTMIGEGYNGYSVVQGGCTDGTYAYYLMVSSATQHGRVLKVRMKDQVVVGRSKVLNTWHGNGMAYDSKRKKLVVIARENRKQEITVIDAKTLKITRQQNVRYSHYKNAGIYSLNSFHQGKGLAAIAYVRKYDCYIALERSYHNLIIFNPDTLQAEGFVVTRFTDKYPGTYQAMDADSKYVYLLLSKHQDNPSKQPNNVILALDWNSEKMLPVINAKNRSKAYVKYAWYCNNKNNGQPDAAIKIKTNLEAENIYHKSAGGGKGHFYMSAYYSHSVYSGGRYQFRRDDYVYDLGTF